MSMKVMRLGFLAGLAILFAGVIVGAQDRKDAEPVGRASIDVFNVVEGRTVVITSVPEERESRKAISFASSTRQRFGIGSPPRRSSCGGLRRTCTQPESPARWRSWR